MDKLLSHLTSYMASINNIEKVVLFGSRARGTQSERSDYDIAIFGKLTAEDKGAVTKYISYDAPTLHKIDYIFAIDVANDSDIAKSINKEGVIIYERK